MNCSQYQLLEIIIMQHTYLMSRTYLPQKTGGEWSFVGELSGWLLRDVLCLDGGVWVLGGCCLATLTVSAA